MLRTRTASVLLLTILFFAFTGCYNAVRKSLNLPPFESSYGHHETVQVPMRDGAKLNTDIYFPEGEGPWPAIMIRNPYNMWNVSAPIWKFLTRYGYVVVHQDVRGRFASEGEWLPLLNERSDGTDMLKWLTAQTWQNKNIALFGASYLGAVQWMVADRLPPEVKTIMPFIIGTDLRSAMYEKGMFRHELFSFWAAIMPDNRMGLFNGRGYQKLVRHWPPIEGDVEDLGIKLPWYRQWLMAAPLTAPLWQLPLNKIVTELPKRVNVPVMFFTAWYDLFPKQAYQDYLNVATKDESRILIGPWTHLLGSMGDGEKAFLGAGDYGAPNKVINWLEHYLKGKPLEEWGPIATYAIGEDKWRDWQTWPPANTTVVDFYLHDPKGAKDCRGLMNMTAGSEGETVRFQYDPRNPAPSRGGAGMLSYVIPQYMGSPPSNRDQKGMCDRDDVLTFVSPPLKHDLHIMGPITVNLTVASSAEDTSFTAKLIEIDENGKALNVRDSISSIAYRNDATAPLSYTPGEKVQLAIDMWPIEWEVKKGYRLRVDISSSNFPAYHAHANRAGPWALQADPIKAMQTVYLDGALSKVSIPVWRKN